MGWIKINKDTKQEKEKNQLTIVECKMIVQFYQVFFAIIILISRQMSSYTLMRSFVLEKQVTLESQILKGEVQIANGYGDITDILNQIGDPSLYKFKIYDFSDNKYHLVKDFCVEFEEVQQGYFVPAQFLRTEIVLMKYALDASQTNSMKSGSQSASDASSTKKQRSKERTIAQVIQIVKQWREIHTSTANGKKVNLQQSAEMLGISKKSLDDYYYQLRLGEKYDFDFSSHLNDKVGVLRTFIKDIKSSKKQSRAKLQKHPKKLKIIQQQFGQNYTKPSKSKSKSSSKKGKSHSQSSQQNQVNQKEIEMQQQIVEDPNKKQLNSIENQFYNQFQFMGEEPPDPFLNFQCDFKKKSYDDLSDQLFF